MRLLLQPIGRRGTRQLTLQPGDVGLELDAVPARIAKTHRQLEHRDVDRDDDGQQGCEQHDPRDATREWSPLGGLRCLPRALLSACRGLTSVGIGRQIFTAARSRADDERGFASISRADGRTGLRVSARSSGSLPQLQIGNSGGHVQPLAF